MDRSRSGSLLVGEIFSDSLSALAFGCMVTALAFAPLAFGGVEPWAYSVLAVLAYTACAAALGHVVLKGNARRLAAPMLIPLALGLLLIAAQSLSLPLQFTADAGQPPTQRPGGALLSLYPHATREALVRFSAYAALFVAAFTWMRTRGQAMRLMGAITCIGFAVSLFAIIQNLSGADALYWWRHPRYGGAIFGPFVSRNQFASYAGLCCFAGMAWLLARQVSPRRVAEDWWEKLTWSVNPRLHQELLVSFATAIMAAAILWSLSRAGILSALCAFALVAFLLTRTDFPARRGRLYAASLFVLIIGIVSYLGWGPVVERLSSTKLSGIEPSASWRWRMAMDGLRMGEAYPIFGAGAGTFFSSYPYFRTLPTPDLATSPHNEYIHVFAETGLAGVAILVLAMALFYTRVIKGVFSTGKSDPPAAGFLAGGLGGLLMVSVHSIFDFPMRSPAVAATAAVMAALLYRAAGGGLEEEPTPEMAARLRRSAHRGSRSHLPVLPLGLALLAVWAISCNAALNSLRGQLEQSLIQRTEPHEGASAAEGLRFVNSVEQSVRRHSPGDAQLRASLAKFSERAAAAITDPLERSRMAYAALALHKTAAELEPMNADHPYAIALWYLQARRPRTAAYYGDQACLLLPHDPWVRLDLAHSFAACGNADMARHYLSEAERLAAAQRVGEALPDIAVARQQIETDP